jgi:4-oxalocrotonate tautomerase
MGIRPMIASPINAAERYAPADFSLCDISDTSKEEMMPHVIVKLYPGRSELQKARLAEEIVKDVVAIAKCEENSVSVAIEEIKPEDWAEKVYRPDILNNQKRLYKKPGYNPFT